jgi:hypothetical protein
MPTSEGTVMNKLLLFVAPVALLGMTATNVAAGPAGWGGSIVRDVSASTVGTGTPLVLVQRRGGGGRGFAGGGNINRGSINRGNFSNRTFNSGNFQRNVVVNRNVAVVGRGGYYGPNWGGVAAGVAVGASVAAVGAAAANAANYPPPPPYPYYPYGY